jgi:hypothetical protein
VLLRRVADNSDLITNAGSVLAQYCAFLAVGIDGVRAVWGGGSAAEPF